MPAPKKNPEFFTRLEDFINYYQERYGVSPTTQIISDGTGLSTATVSRYLQFMRKNGMIEYEGHRSIRTRKSLEKMQQRMQQNMQQKTTETVLAPILGAVSCGIPKFAQENIEEYVSLPVSLFGNGDYYLLRAYGDSMIEAGIEDGDLVLVRRQDTAEPSEIVVALVEDEATLKRYFPEKNSVRLHPENSTMVDIYVENCVIQGVAVKVLKDLK